MDYNFDTKFSINYKNVVIDYGLINGNNTIVFFKVGLNGSLNGYENKYLKMAKLLNQEKGFSCLVATNPSNAGDSIKQGIEFIKQYAASKGFKKYEVYYFGFSNGGYQGLVYAKDFPEIKKVISINPPLMLNPHLITEGIKGFCGKEMHIICGTQDQSFKLFKMFTELKDQKNIYLHEFENADHQFSGKLNQFISLRRLFTEGCLYFSDDDSNHMFVVTFGNICHQNLKERLIGDNITLTDVENFCHPTVVHTDVFFLISDSEHTKELDKFITDNLPYYDIALLPLIPEGSNLETGAIRYTQTNFDSLISFISKFLNRIALSPLGTDSAFNSFQYEPRTIFIAEKEWRKDINFITEKPVNEIHEIWIFHNSDDSHTMQDLYDEINNIPKELCDYDVHSNVAEALIEKDKFLIFIN